MKEEFTYRNTPGDYWRFYMSNIYHQWTAVINVVFTAAALALIIARWGSAQAFFRGLMILALLIFPLFQPLAIYLRSRKQALAIKVDTTLSFDEGGFGIQVKAHHQRILWKDFHGVICRADLIVLMPDEVHAYLLPDRVTGERKQELLGGLKRVLPAAANRLK